MEKISGILPPNKRITTVDMKSSGFARPGSPSFGRMVGPSPAPFHELHTTQRAMEQLHEQNAMRDPHHDPKVDIVTRMADQFFVREGRDENAQPIPPKDPNLEAEQGTMRRRIRDERNAEATPRGDLRSDNQLDGDTGDQLVSGQHLDVRA